MNASQAAVRRSGALRVLIAVLVPTAIALAWVLASRGALDVQTDVIGYPVFYDYNYRNFFNAYYAGVLFVPLVCLVLGVGGAAWTTSNQNFQISVQMSAPRRLAARAIAAYLLTFQGGQAIGSALWGAVADQVGDPVALTIAAAGTVLGLVAAVRWVVQDHGPAAS